MESLFTRIIQAIFVGVLTGLAAFLVIVILMMLAPQLGLDAAWWGGIIGLLAGIYAFVTGSRL